MILKLARSKKKLSSQLPRSSVRLHCWVSSSRIAKRDASVTATKAPLWAHPQRPPQKCCTEEQDAVVKLEHGNPEVTKKSAEGGKSANKNGAKKYILIHIKSLLISSNLVHVCTCVYLYNTIILELYTTYFSDCTSDGMSSLVSLTLARPTCRHQRDKTTHPHKSS